MPNKKKKPDLAADETPEVTPDPAEGWVALAALPIDDEPTEEGAPNLKPDSSSGALAQLFAEGEHITHHLLDEIEKRSDVGDIKWLVAFAKRALEALGAQE